MKLRSLLAVALLGFGLSSSLFAQSRVLTVDNNPGKIAMFNNIADAYEAAQPGDTLLLAGSATHYGGIAVKKRLNIVGPGYWLVENGVPGLSTQQAAVDVGLGMTAEGSSTGSTFTGLHLGYYVDAGVNVGTTAIDRCRLNWNGSGQGLRIPNQVTIRRCVSDSGALYLHAAGSSIRNSVINHGIFLAAGTTVANCVILQGYGTYDLSESSELSSISNTIFVSRDQGFTGTGFKGSVTHCMAVAPLTGASFLPVGGGNINGMASELVFVGTGSPDGQWRLRPNSPAIGMGFDGVDMGAFGGSTPYILSGVPSRPRLTRFVVPAAVTGTSGLRFEVDAQSF
jgi:hypothetical protein